MLFQLKRVQEECSASIRSSRGILEQHDAECNTVRNQIQQLDVETRLKDQEAQQIGQDCDRKRSDISRLASARSAIHQCEQDYESAQRTHDEFMSGYATKSANYKKQIKVSIKKRNVLLPSNK